MTALHPALSAAQLEAIEMMRESEAFLLVGHMRPDGDCIGSEVALARILAQLGKRVVVMNPDAPPERFASLRGELDVRTFDGAAPPQHDVCVLLDINLLSRTGAMQAALEASPSAKMVIDHHAPAGPAWWDAAFIDTTASATGLLVARIAQALGQELDPVAAEAVFCAIVTDTGWFKYSNTDPETMALAAQLVSLGVNPSELYARLYQQDRPDLPLAIAGVLAGLRYECEGRLAVIEHPHPGANGLDLEDPDPVLDIVRAVGAVEVVIYLRELGDGRCKLSLRSKTDFDVNALAGRFGGGGHIKASGATIRGSLADVRARVVSAAAGSLAAGCGTMKSEEVAG